MTTFSGGAALEAKLSELAEKLGDGKTLRVGFLEGATYPDGQSVPMVARYSVTTGLTFSASTAI